MVCGVRELDMTEQLTVPTDVLTAFLGGGYSTPPNSHPGAALSPVLSGTGTQSGGQGKASLLSKVLRPGPQVSPAGGSTPKSVPTGPRPTCTPTCSLQQG